MTPEDYAIELVSKRSGPMFWMRRSENPAYKQDEIDEIAAIVRAAVSEARRSERERCAAVADAYGCGSSGSIPAAEFAARYGQHDSLAAAIRALD